MRRKQTLESRVERKYSTLVARINDRRDRQRAKAAGVSFITYLKAQGREYGNRSVARFKVPSAKARFLMFAKLRNDYRKRRSIRAIEQGKTYTESTRLVDTQENK